MRRVYSKEAHPEHTLSLVKITLPWLGVMFVINVCVCVCVLFELVYVTEVMCECVPFQCYKDSIFTTTTWRGMYKYRGGICEYKEDTYKVIIQSHCRLKCLFYGFMRLK